MTAILYALGFILLLFAITVLLMGLASKVAPRPEPELLVVDDPLPDEAEQPDAATTQEARA